MLHFSTNIKTSFNKEFNKNSIRTILTNKKYIGIYSYKGKETKDAIPRIIDDVTFQKAQEKLQKNKEAPSRSKAKAKYLLTTKLFCGTCKEMMVGVSGTSHTGKLHCYYSCKGSWQNKCNRKNIPKDYIEDLVIEQVINYLTTENINTIAKNGVKLAEKEKNRSRLHQLEKSLKEIEKQKTNVFDSLKICYDNNVRKSIFEEIAKMDKQKADIENQIILEKNSYFQFTVPQIRAFLKKLKKGKFYDFKYRQMLINVLVYRIYLYEDNITIIFNTQDRTFTNKIPSIENIEGVFIQKCDETNIINENLDSSHLGKNVLPCKKVLTFLQKSIDKCQKISYN